MAQFNEQFIFPPKGGFEPQTYYVVEIAMNMNNPIFQDIFYTGFLNGRRGIPGGYNKLFTSEATYDNVKYMKVIRKIDNSVENKDKMIRDVLMREYPELLV
jgi:hypothetical protein